MPRKSTKKSLKQQQTTPIETGKGIKGRLRDARQLGEQRTIFVHDLHSVMSKIRVYLSHEGSTIRRKSEHCLLYTSRCV